MQLFENRIGRSGPLKWLAVRVVGGHEVIDALDQLLDAGEGTAADGLVSERGTDNFLRVLEVLTGTPKDEEPTEAPDVTRYRYDGSHQLVAIEHADGARTEYDYDALGRRVAKHHTTSGGTPQTTLFRWDGDWMVQEVRIGGRTRTPP